MTIVNYPVKTKQVWFYCGRCDYDFQNVTTLRPYCPLCHTRDYITRYYYEKWGVKNV